MRMAATAAVFNRLPSTSVGVIGGVLAGAGANHQLARSLERILEEAHYSGELILTNRKLKDFPKTGTKYNLNDTVIAGKSFRSSFLFKNLKKRRMKIGRQLSSIFVRDGFGCGFYDTFFTVCLPVWLLEAYSC